jgi:hypothetical protein
MSSIFGVLAAIYEGEVPFASGIEAPARTFQGLPLETDGSLAVDYVNAPSRYLNGLPFTAEGRLPAVVAYADYYHNGLGFDSTGRITQASLPIAYSPETLFANGETGTFLDFTTTQVYADTAGTDPAEVGEGIALTLDKSQGANILRRNLLAYTEEFDNAFWEKSATATVTANQIAAPDNTTTADLFRCGTTSASEVRRNNITLAAGNHTFSVFARKEVSDFLVIQVFDVATTSFRRVWFNINLGSTGSATSGGTNITLLGSSIEPYENGFYRVSITVSLTAGTVSGRTNIFLSEGDGVFSGNALSGIYIWGAQLETGSTLTPYQEITTGINGEWTPGTHSTQATSAARPIFGRVPVGGRRNLLLRTEEFGNAYYSKAGSTSATGTSVTFSASSGDYLGNNAVVLSAITGETFTISGLLSCEPADVGETIDVGFDLSGETNRFSSPVALSETPTPVSFSWTLTANGNVGFRVRNIGATAKSFTLDNFQIEKASTATPYQKVVTQYDITEAGIPSIYKAFFDKADDILPVTLPTITGGTVALVGTSGIWIEEDWGFTAGTLSIGPTTIAGLPAGILSVVGDLCAVIINDRAWTAAEYAEVVSWGKARGAPGVFSLGEELVTNGDFATNDLTGWTDNSTGTGSVAVADEAVELTGAGPANRGRIDQLISSFEVGSNYVLGVNSTVAINTQAVVTGVLSVNVTPPYSRFIFVPDITERAISFNVFGTGTNTLDNISVRKLELLP